VRDDVVDRRGRRPPAGTEHVGGSAQPLCEHAARACSPRSQ
jgi:hypothetical protein